MRCDVCGRGMTTVYKEPNGEKFVEKDLYGLVVDREYYCSACLNVDKERDDERD